MADNLERRFLIQRIITGSRKRKVLLRQILFLYAEKRRKIVSQMLLVVLLLLFSIQNATHFVRSCRRLPRNTGWWNVVWITYSHPPSSSFHPHRFDFRQLSSRHFACFSGLAHASLPKIKLSWIKTWNIIHALKSARQKCDSMNQCRTFAGDATKLVGCSTQIRPAEFNCFKRRLSIVFLSHLIKF